MNPQRKIRSNTYPAALLCCALALAGCTGYRVGSMLPEDIQTVYVPTFVNHTDEPMIEIDCTDATLAEIQKDGSLRIASADTADTVLHVDLTGYTTTPIAYNEQQVEQVDEYRITLTADMRLMRRAGGQPVVTASGVIGQSTFRVVGDLSSSKMQGLPEAAADLGNRIVEKMVEAWN